MSAKKVKVKVSRKKLNFKNIFIAFIILLLCIIIFIDILKLSIKNIYINGNEILSDKDIIEIAGIGDYPSYIGTFFSNIKGKILENDYVMDVNIKRTISRKIFIEIEEYKPLFMYNEKLVLSSGSLVDNVYNIDYVPFVKNNIDDVFIKFVSNFKKVDKDVLVKISQVEYCPNDVDSERFLLYMIDSNYVYITLSKIDKLNKYNFIVQQMDRMNGIIYLDSGDYVEIKG